MFAFFVRLSSWLPSRVLSRMVRSRNRSRKMAAMFGRLVFRHISN